MDVWDTINILIDYRTHIVLTVSGERLSYVRKTLEQMHPKFAQNHRDNAGSSNRTTMLCGTTIKLCDRDTAVMLRNRIKGHSLK